MSRLALAILGFAIASNLPASAESAPCVETSGKLGVSRIVEIDTASGPLYGDITRYEKEESMLAPKEVVLTFDDGPIPWITKSILNTLDRFCTKATFFAVGQMALAYPASVRDVHARGHTLGTHTWSHPLNLRRLSFEKAIDQIERGFAAVAMAAGTDIAPFFRFPGLNDSGPLLAEMQRRGIATFTVDVVSDDSYIGDPGQLARTVLRRVEERQGGIMLFHDIKPATAKALPAILSELAKRGYKVVHLRPKTAVEPLQKYAPELTAMLAKSGAKAIGQNGIVKAELLPFFGSIGPEKIETAPVTELTPAPRPRPMEVLIEKAQRTRKPKHRDHVAAADDDSANSALQKPLTGAWRARVKKPNASNN